MSPVTNSPSSRSAWKAWPCGQPGQSPGSRIGTSIAGAATDAAALIPSDARSNSGENSPIDGKVSLPWQVRPHARTCVSITGSSSSTTYSVSTDAANSRISPSGSGFTMPSFKTDASGSTSRT